MKSKLGIIIILLVISVSCSAGIKGDLYKLGDTGYTVNLEGKYEKPNEDVYGSNNFALKNENGTNLFFLKTDKASFPDSVKDFKSLNKYIKENEVLGSKEGNLKISRSELLGEKAVLVSSINESEEQKSFIKKITTIKNKKMYTLIIFGEKEKDVDKAYENATKSLKKVE